jgi:Saxitoxin biosynthesis operon protein SxtJ
MSAEGKKTYFTTNLSKKQFSDAGQAAVLILLLVGFFTKKVIFYEIGMVALVVNMAAPTLFFPFAYIWYGITNILGEIVSKVILTVVYFVVLFPVSMYRKMIGKDSLQLKVFKKSGSSVMEVRNHLFTPSDIEHPY